MDNRIVECASMLEDYCTMYAPKDSEEANANFAGVEKVFAPWEEAKSQHLMKMFGGELILERPISISKPQEDSRYELDNLTCMNFARMYYNAINEMGEDQGYDFNARYNLSALIRIDALYSNVYSGDTFEVPIRGLEHPIKVNHGCKVIRVLGKLAKALHLEDDFEAFRLEHSRILNDKYLHGTLCLSIHPMDYMTMSDNGNRWTSCMSWIENGCYHQGTVEMMNSPMVVVAYLKSNDKNTWNPCGGKWAWVSKKWRELIIVTEYNITGILGYPYESREMESTAMAWIKELAEKNLGWKYKANVYEFNAGDNFNVGTDEEPIYVGFQFETDYMYNDFGDNHYTYVQEDIEDGSSITLNYSGVNECMICGEIDCIENEADTCCPSCENFMYCDMCGERLYSSDDRYCVDDRCLCEGCYNEQTAYCPICEEDHIVDGSMITVHISLDKKTYEDGVSSTCCEGCFDKHIGLDKTFMVEPKHRPGYLCFRAPKTCVYIGDLTKEQFKMLYNEAYGEDWCDEYYDEHCPPAEPNEEKES